MVGKFLNLDDDTPKPDASIGAGLKRKPKPQRGRADTKAVAAAGEAHGFTRATQPQPPRAKKPKLEPDQPRRGRPPLNEAMTYWRIYVAPDLRDELNAIRDKEGKRLNDVLRDMLAVYKSQKR
ncbi:MAG: hypothetical protein ABJL99_27055 [Aliishimia sp.]